MLSTVLREATAVAHDRAERSEFVADLMDGKLDADAYRQLAIQLFYVYEALEAVGGRLADDPIVAPMIDERLGRIERLRSDLQVLGLDEGWQTTHPASPATAAYVSDIESTVTDPPTYVAHHYTRYLGDLSGGQVIRSRMKLHYGLTDEALTFYDFSDIGKLKPYKDSYRDRLDGLPIDAATRDRIAAAAVRAFEHNEALFGDLVAS
ncbi:heme oxygenase (biliverdin-producing) [Jongsikchunia kroppenstedtii]|uniref:biliverdin-producing heme oxygenase n=1 Tax=Jongsikchunia kroppenstedtii TaxID=1121721 RepID=UPI0003600FB8|nr:biliverdin-producing heme oxygenase [Jongsikchunia kroppenstedtii]